jgi:hypothetical protein
VSHVSLALSVILLGALSGYTINDPTENEFAPSIINDTAYSAIIAYCNGTSSCGMHLWTENLRPGERTSDSINAGRGNLSVFVVQEGGRRFCIRLARYTKAIHLSTATLAGCHAPYS